MAFTLPQQSVTSALGGGGNPFMNFLQSNGGSSIVSGLMGGLGSMGAARSNERMNQQQLDLQRQQLGQQGQQFGMQDQFNRDALLADQSPTGWAQNYEQQTLMKNIMLQKLMAGSQLQPTNPAVAERLAASGTGNFKPTIPDEWQQHNPFGVDMSSNSIQQRQGVLDLLSGGRGPGMDITQYGGNQGQQDQMQQYRNSVNQSYGNQQQGLMQAIGMKPDGTQMQFGGQPQQGHAVAGRLGSAASGAMQGASMGSIIPGLGTGIGAGIGALMGLAGGGGPTKQQQIQQLGGTVIPSQGGFSGRQQFMQQNNDLLQQLMAGQGGRQFGVPGQQQPLQQKNPYLGNF